MPIARVGRATKLSFCVPYIGRKSRAMEAKALVVDAAGPGICRSSFSECRQGYATILRVVVKRLTAAAEAPGGETRTDGRFSRARGGCEIGDGKSACRISRFAKCPGERKPIRWRFCLRPLESAAKRVLFSSGAAGAKVRAQPGTEF